MVEVTETIGRPGLSLSASASAVTLDPEEYSTREPVVTPVSKPPFPSRRIYRPSINSSISDIVLETWRESVGLSLGPMIPTEEHRRKVLLLLFHYRHLNGKDLTDLPCTDLIVHRVQLKEGTKPAASITRKRYPNYQEWWLRKIIGDGIEGGIYELTERANGRLSPWNANPVIVDKVPNPTPEDEPRVTLDFSRCLEVLPGCSMELSSKVHDNLSNPKHNTLMAADLKHAYLTIGLHPDDRYIFAFTIPGIGQLQPTRMHQGSQSAGFTMTELIYRAFGHLPPPHNEPSLLHSSHHDEPPPLVFYMDDIFGGQSGFDEQYSLLREHFFPRIEWAMLRLSFKKLKLFQSTVKALGVTHHAGGLLQIIDERVEKIIKWPVPTTQTDVRAFLGSTGITKRWVKNFYELAKPLTRLTGKVPFRWDDAEQLSFELIKIKCATRTMMHGINPEIPNHLYTDASGMAAGLCITQFQKAKDVDVPPTKELLVEVPILFDSFGWTISQRRYPTYKKELCAIVTFAKKYDYLCRHPAIPAIIHTDHKPLTHFLTSDGHDGIYGNWADQLRRMNVVIKWIPGHRNKVADGLSRTLFDNECSSDKTVALLKKELQDRGPQWIWKDGKDGFEAFLASLDERKKTEVVDLGTLDGTSVFVIEVLTLSYATEAFRAPQAKSWKEAYEASSWFGEIYKFLMKHNEANYKKAGDIVWEFETIGDILWIHRRGAFLPCVPETKVLSVLKEVHDDDGHWAKTGTIARLRGLCYWPNQATDVEKYIMGCLACAQHGPATRSQPLHPIHVTLPFQLCGMDFIGPLKTTASGNKFIFNYLDYMSRFAVPFATKTANVEEVIWCLKLALAMYRKPMAIYCDPGHHFDNDELREFLAREGVSIEYSPSGSSKSTGMVEASNRILEEVLRRQKSDTEWDVSLPDAGSAANTRTIGYLGYSPTSILWGPMLKPTASTSVLLALPGRDIKSWVQEMDNQESHAAEFRKCIKHVSEVHDVVTELSKQQKLRMAARYDRGVRQVSHNFGDLVMLWQKDVGKLQARWRGPFKISGHGGTHGRSFTLEQLNGRRIKGTFHGDHLKTFVPRTGYLADPNPDPVPQKQSIRHRGKKKNRGHAERHNL